ncbi:MAG: chloride channel protein [Phycisphaerales bacterium]|nr:chloride channel protein [Phycisphaerales bacterium]MCB9837338.1 chloride channel protein [Phycisphaera sp.]
MASFLTNLTKARSAGRKPWNSGHGTEWWLIVIGAIIGSLTGLGAVAFDKTLEYVNEHVMHTQREASWMLIVTPVVGMALTGVLVKLFASEAKGHGVPQVMNALIKRGGLIRWPIGVVKVIASILTVGSGGSAGTEGPVVQIGATVGSVVGQRLHMTREHMGTLVGCGAAAGISSIFNAPIAGVFFVLEILLRDFSVKAFAPIVVASVFSQATTQAVLGENHAIFATPGDLHGYTFSIFELPGFVLLGGVCGLVAVGFNLLLHKGEDLYDDWKLHPLLKPITGGLALGLIGYAFILALNAAQPEHGAHVPMFYGNGYSTIRELLDPKAYDTGSGSIIATSVVLLTLLVLLKMVGTVFTLASGGSGGVFAPSLFLGAVAGAALGVALERMGLMPEGGSPAAYALVGMAAVVAGTTHATLTSILILFELTRNVYVLLPIMLAAVVATVVATVLERDSIYTFKLRREGVLLGGARDISLLRKIPVTSVPIEPLPEDAVFASDPLGKLVSLHANYHVPDFVVVEQDGSYIGMVTGKDMRTALIDREAIPLLLVAELLRTDLPVIHPDETLDVVVDRFAEHDVSSLCLVTAGKNPRPIGLITRIHVMSRYREALEES